MREEWLPLEKKKRFKREESEMRQPLSEIKFEKHPYKKAYSLEERANITQVLVYAAPAEE